MDADCLWMWIVCGCGLSVDADCRCLLSVDVDCLWVRINPHPQTIHITSTGNVYVMWIVCGCRLSVDVFDGMSATVGQEMNLSVDSLWV